MGRKKEKCEGGGGCPAWMTTFSDLMSLLLTFFVLLLSMASLDQKKIKEALGSLQGALGVLEGGFKTEVSKELILPSVGITPPKKLVMERLKKWAYHAFRPGRGQAFRNREGYIKSKETEKGPVEVRETKEGIVVSVMGGVLFDPGDAVLKPEGKKLLDSLIPLLKNLNYPIRIEGHTDDTPVVGGKYKSNWELSVARAISVLRYLISKGLDPKKMSVAGYGPYKPIYPNDTPEHRARNRRVDIVILVKSEETKAKVGPEVEIE